jgi:S-adenosyl methyltransferase
MSSGDTDSAHSDSAAFDTSTAHIARVYDYWLGGKDNYAADRAVGDQVRQAYPNIAHSVRANRAFLARAVSYLVSEAGVRQFLDIGTGIPSANNTHEVAQAAAPESRVVYVDNDPVVLVHARALLSSDPAGVTDYIDADLRDTAAVLSRAGRTLDLAEPVAVMLLGILHMIPDADDPAAIVTALMGATASGSFLTISHPASDIDAAAGAEASRRYNAQAAESATFRSHAQVLGLFDGLDLVPPGLVPVPQWRPRSEIEAKTPSNLWGAMGRKP